MTLLTHMRQVNISKGGFLFPAAQYLSTAIQNYEEEFLITIPTKVTDEERSIRITAMIHAEFLFIHPFREGNGRTARLFVNLIAALKHGFESFHFNRIIGHRAGEYIVSDLKSTRLNSSHVATSYP